MLKSSIDFGCYQQSTTKFTLGKLKSINTHNKYFIYLHGASQICDAELRQSAGGAGGVGRARSGEREIMRVAFMYYQFS